MNLFYLRFCYYLYFYYKISEKIMKNYSLVLYSRYSFILLLSYDITFINLNKTAESIKKKK